MIMMMINNDQAKIIQGFPAGRLHPLPCVLRVPQLGRDEDLLPGRGKGDGGDNHGHGGDDGGDGGVDDHDHDNGDDQSIEGYLVLF